MTQRVVRSTAMARYVKDLHDHCCQVCGTRLETSAGPYSEAAHIRPLGQPHNGPDVPGNVLCLCPNHHVLFDLGGIAVHDDGAVSSKSNHQTLSVLETHPGHSVDKVMLTYHREHIAS